jgi:uncharacterized iron-regulated protein
MRSKSASARQELAQERAPDASTYPRSLRFGRSSRRSPLPRGQARRPSACLAALVIAGVSLAAAQAGAQTSAACSTYGSWIDGAGNTIDGKDLVRDLASRSAVVLLGESHTSPDHHAWQMQTVAGLRGRTDNMVLGFESFPRRLQGVLDDWVAGKLSAEAFLNAVEWRRVWGYDSALYMPLFQFARLNRIPMVALNVERSLVSRVGREGWAAVPQDAREGLTDPASASEGYLRELAAVQAMKRILQPGADPQTAPSDPDEAAIAEAMKQPEFTRFVEAQLTWDRAFAQGIVDARRKYAGATVVAVLGSGHVAYGYGTPHQLKDLGVTGVTSLIPISVDNACTRVGKSFADALFTLPPGGDEAPTVERPRLGVELVQGEGAPRINRVVGNSVAEAAGIKAGDHIVRAAGLEMRSPDDVVDVIGRQAPGTWLPLSIRREGEVIEIVAKFPPRPRQG